MRYFFCKSGERSLIFYGLVLGYSPAARILRRASREQAPDGFRLECEPNSAAATPCGARREAPTPKAKERAPEWGLFLLLAVSALRAEQRVARLGCKLLGNLRQADRLANE